MDPRTEKMDARKITTKGQTNDRDVKDGDEKGLALQETPRWEENKQSVKRQLQDSVVTFKTGLDSENNFLLRD